MVWPSGAKRAAQIVPLRKVISWKVGLRNGDGAMGEVIDACPRGQDQQSGDDGHQPARARLLFRDGADAAAGGTGNIGEGFQVEGHIAGRLKTFGGIFFQAVAHDAFERGRNIAIGLGEVGRILFQDGAHGLDGGFAVEGALAGEHLIENGAEGEDVGARVGGLAANLFGRHVAGGAHHGSGFGGGLDGGRVAGEIGFGARDFGETEVENLGPAVVGDEKIFRLQVAMDDALFVRGGQAAGDLLGVVDGFAGSERAVAQAVAEGLALEQFGDDVGRAVFLADIEDGENVGMVQRRGRAGFLREALQALGIGGERCGQNLDGDVAV